MPGNLEESKRRVCLSAGCEFVPVSSQDRAGLALSSIGKIPINGLRHPFSAGTTGWYIWCGEEFLQTSNFFQSICVDHLIERLPSVERFLSLAPGYRFLLADGYEDVWFDETLFNV